MLHIFLVLSYFELNKYLISSSAFSSMKVLKVLALFKTPHLNTRRCSIKINDRISPLQECTSCIVSSFTAANYTQKVHSFKGDFRPLFRGLVFIRKTFQRVLAPLKLSLLESVKTSEWYLKHVKTSAMLQETHCAKSLQVHGIIKFA